MVQSMFVLLSAVVRDRKGVSSLEYAVLAFGIIGAVTLALQSFGTGLSGIFADIIADLPTHTSS